MQPNETAANEPYVTDPPVALETRSSLPSTLTITSFTKFPINNIDIIAIVEYCELITDWL